MYRIAISSTEISNGVISVDEIAILYIVQLFEENYFNNAARKRITINPLSRKPETMFTPSGTLKNTL